MSQFLRLANGDLVNADHLSRIGVRYPPKDQGDRARPNYLAYDRDGDCLGHLDWSFDPALLTPIVPQGSQLNALVISCYPNDDETDGWEAYCDYVLIIGWRLEYTVPTPVLVEDVQADALVAIPTGDNHWSVPFDCSGSVEELKARAIGRAKSLMRAKANAAQQTKVAS